MARYLNFGQLALLRTACEQVNDRPAQLRFLIELAALAPQELTPFLLDAELEKAASPASIHQLAKALPPEAALQLHAFLKSPVLKLAVSSALVAPPADLLVADVTAAHEHLRQERVDAKDKGLGDTMDLWNEQRSVLKYFARALKAATAPHKLPILMVGRDALRESSGIWESPEEFLSFWTVDELLPLVWSPDVRSEYIPGLAHFAALSPVDDAKEVEETILKLGSTITEREFVEALTNATSITPRLLQLALDGARRIGAEDGALTWNGVRLAMHLARAGRVVEAIEIAKLTEKYDVHRLSALVGLATELPFPHYLPFLQEAWQWITTPLYYHRNWNDADKLRKLSPRAIEQPKAVLIELWQKGARFVGSQPRPDSWDYLAALAPVIHELAGPQGALETWKAARDVTRWWP
jgi:hypothetical protein